MEIGIGDDAAVLRSNEGSLVWTVDCAVEGAHFRRAWLSLEEIGWRSLMAAASDLAAMGARPRGVLSALILPPGFTDDELDELVRGQARAAAAMGSAVIGGNLSRGSELSITTTVLGQCRAPILRSGGRVGDLVAVAGRLGLAAAGLEALIRGGSSADLSAAIEAWRRPLARIDAGLAGATDAHAAIDLSDGLVLDATRLARASGLGILLEAQGVIAAGGSALADASRALGLDALELALFGGEDYALVMTFPSAKLPPPFVAIGTCIAEAGVYLRLDDGTLRELEPRGFDHFAE